MIECSRLNGYQCFGKNSILNRTVHKCTATDVDDISSEVKSSHINGSFRTRVCYDCDITACQLCVLPISVGDDFGNTKVISADAVIPVLRQIQRQGLRRKVYVYVLCADKREFAYILNRSGDTNGRKFRAIIECITTNIGHAFGNVEFGQTFAEAERKVIDIRNLRVAEINARQLAHSLKSVRLNARQRASLHKHYGPKILATVKQICRNARQFAVLGKRKGSQIRAAHKRSLRHCGYVCGHRKGS